MDFKIYTKTGDDGTTSLVGGNRVKKSEVRLEAYGTVDELNSWIGLIAAETGDEYVKELLAGVQNNLFVIGSRLASDEKGRKITGHLVLGPDDITILESAIDAFERELKPLSFFILPGGSVQVSHCHIARTICRRAERRIVTLASETDVEEWIVKYINRLSDFLFVLARKTAHDSQVEETGWRTTKH